MGGKNSIKLITIFLIIFLVIITITGFFIYKLYNDKQSTGNEQDKTDISSEASTDKEKDTSSDLNDYVFELDSKNKYIITTDLRWKTMLDDGGSNTSLYYQIDLDNNIICKVKEDYTANANLRDVPSIEKNVIYIKKIDNTIQEEVKALLTEIISKEDINDSNNYNYFTISSLNDEKDIFNMDTIESINLLLNKIDELK